MVPVVQRKRAGDRVQQRRLARAVGADDDDERAFLDGQVDALQRRALRWRAGEERLADAANLEHG